MKQYECDDGNNVNGDGCSEDCKIEYGFECHSNGIKPDVCIDILPPTALLSVGNGNVLKIIFSENMKFDFTSKEGKEYIEISLKGTDYVMKETDWDFKTKFDTSSKIKELTITTNILYTIQGSAEDFIVSFKNLEKVHDIQGNKLLTSNLTGDRKSVV